jgi:outer membrane protein assembly factor BamB
VPLRSKLLSRLWPEKENTRDFIYCLDATDGEVKWTFDYPCDLEPRLHPGGPSSTPTVDDGRVYTLSKFGDIYCLDARTGKKVWEASGRQYKPKKPWWGFAASPTVIGNVVIYNVGNRGFALNKDTGEVIWQSEQGVVAYATPKPLPVGMFDRPAVALFTNSDFLVLDPATGESVATYEKTWEEKSNCNGVTPYIHDGHIYLVHSAHGMARLSVQGNTLKQDWLSEDGKYANEWFAFATHVVHGDNIYFSTKDRKKGGTGLHCVDARTGKRKLFDEKYAFANLLRVGDKLLMLSEEGELIWGELGEASFKETHRQKILDGLCWAKPVLLEDRLYARDAEGTVVCLQLL